MHYFIFARSTTGSAHRHRFAPAQTRLLRSAIAGDRSTSRRLAEQLHELRSERPFEATAPRFREHSQRVEHAHAFLLRAVDLVERIAQSNDACERRARTRAPSLRLNGAVPSFVVRPRRDRYLRGPAPVPPHPKPVFGTFCGGARVLSGQAHPGVAHAPARSHHTLPPLY